MVKGGGKKIKKVVGLLAVEKIEYGIVLAETIVVEVGVW